MVNGRKELLTRLADKEGEFFVLISACTREPYVECDEETFDDKVFLYFDGEEAKQAAQTLAGKKIPVTVTRLESKQMLFFFTNLYAMGVNAIEIPDEEKPALVQLDEIIKKREKAEMPDGAVWVENPQLHLTALYFMQEMRRQEKPELTEELKGLQEEILVNYGRGRFIVAVHKENGMPMLKQKNGDAYQPIFTDILEFRKFNKEDQFKTMAIEAKNVPKMLVNEAKGVVINPYGVNLQIPIVRPEEPQEKK